MFVDAKNNYIKVMNYQQFDIADRDENRGFKTNKTVEYLHYVVCN